MKLDVLDKKIIYQLELDSSQAVSVIARKLKQSKEVINFRINRLKKNEILLGCSAIVDMAKLGYFTFRIYIKWQNMTNEQKQAFYDEIKAKPFVWTTTVLHGKWDFAFFTGFKSSSYILNYHSLWDELQLKYKPHIAESKIAIYAPVYNFNKKFFINFDMNVETIERAYGLGSLVPHDELDEKIIELYASDVRVPLTAIAKKLDVTSETVRQRIKQLEKKSIITGYKINLNLEKMGYQGYRVDFALMSTERNKELFEYLKQHKYFYQINKSIGGADFETEVVVKNFNHLFELLEEVMNRFSDVIKSYEYMAYSEFPNLSIVPD